MSKTELSVTLAELEKYGLVGEVVDRGKHKEVSWTYCGKRRFVIVSVSGSDRRGWLNARAEIRRQLREANVPIPVTPAVSLRKALELPKATDFGQHKYAELEADFTALLDLYAEQQREFRQLADDFFAFRDKLKNARVVSTLVYDMEEGSSIPRRSELTPPEPPRDPQGLLTDKVAQRKHLKGHPSDAIMLALSGGNWKSIKVLQLETLVEAKNLSSTLQYLKSKRLVEKGERGYWRKRTLENYLQVEGSGR